MPNHKSLMERFLQKISPEPNSGCWIWVGARHVTGYGHIKRPHPENKRALAHRVAWELFRGTPPESLEVCHKCDLPPCVNPDHLFLGTHMENMTDAKQKGRMPQGSRQGSSKLTAADVIEIRKMAGIGIQGIHIADNFGVHETTIYHILNGRTWAWLK